MNSGIYTGYSGLRAQMNALEILSNNLANVNTTGFKEEKPFYTLVSRSLQPSGQLEQAINAQAVLSRGAMNVANGALLLTSGELDVALAGPGFLTVQAPQGIRYTRSGALIRDARSTLCTADGFPVLGENGPIVLGPGKVTINEQGEVFVDEARAGRLKIAAFDNPQLLLREGNSLIVPPEGQAPGVANTIVRQGYLEQSNVNPITSVIGLVGIMRNFEAIQKSVNMLMNDINAKSIEKLGR
jgi:flagellar basal-body rod protein FlgG